MKKLSFLCAFIFTLVFFCETAFAVIYNSGNVETRVIITLDDGRTSSSTLLPEQQIPLPVNATEVKVDSFSQNLGNEEIIIQVILPGGSSGYITENGGVFRIPRRMKSA